MLRQQLPGGPVEFGQRFLIRDLRLQQRLLSLGERILGIENKEDRLRPQLVLAFFSGVIR